MLIYVRSPTKEKLLKVAERASAAGETAHNEPFAVTAEILYDAIITADSIGTDFSNQMRIAQPQELLPIAELLR